LKLALALALLAALYCAADWRAVGGALAALDPWLLAAALLLFVPQTLVSAWRWRALVGGLCPIELREALRQTLVASAWNLAAPSKLGDLSKAAMLPRLDHRQRAAAGALVALEKGADVAALTGLLACGASGLGLGGATIGLAVLAGGCALLRIARGVPASLAGRVPALTAWSLGLWLLHLAQIDLFLKAAGVWVAPEVSLSRLPVAIFAGLLPIALWGVGPRDAALVWLFADVAPQATMAAVGLLTALRYLVPGAAGIALVAVRGGPMPATHEVAARAHSAA
jgi:hypothetical protein